MELSAFRAVLLRRWYLLLAVIVCTVGVTALAVVQIGPTYKAESTVLLFPPTTTVAADTTEPANPFLFLSGLDQARDLVIRTLTSNSSREGLARQAPGASFEATPDFTTSGPVILITVDGESHESTMRGLAVVTDQVSIALEGLQDGLELADSEQITSMALTADEKPQSVHKTQIRVGIVAGAGTLLVGLLLIGLLDGLLSARRFGRAEIGKDISVAPSVVRQASRVRRPAPPAPSWSGPTATATAPVAPRNRPKRGETRAAGQPLTTARR